MVTEILCSGLICKEELLSLSEKEIVLTYEGMKERSEELQNLKIVKRKEVAEKIKEAREQGDLSENAEYDSAKEEQAEIEARIVVLEKMLKNAKIIDEDEIEAGKVGVGSRVVLYDFEYDEEQTYLVIGSAEADPVNGKISNESPLGSVLIGRSAGEVVNIEAPDGVLKFKIVEILEDKN